MDALSAGALGFIPRILVLTTLPHRRPESHRFERVNGRHTLRMSCASPYRFTLRLVSAAASRLPDHASGSNQESPCRSGRHSKRSSPQPGVVGGQWTSGYSAAARGSVAPTPCNETRLADLNGPRPSIIRHYLRDCAWCCLAEAEATAVPEKNNLAITYRPGPGVLRGDHALGGPSGPPSDPSPAKITPRHRPLRLAHLPDELSSATDTRPVARSAESGRRRLRAAARLPTQGVDSTPRSPPPISDSPGQPDGHRPAPLPFSTSRPGPTLRIGIRLTPPHLAEDQRPLSQLRTPRDSPTMGR